MKGVRKQVYRCIMPDRADFETVQYCDVLCFVVYQFPLGALKPIVDRAIYRAYDTKGNRVYYKRIG